MKTKYHSIDASWNGEYPYNLWHLGNFRIIGVTLNEFNDVVCELENGEIRTQYRGIIDACVNETVDWSKYKVLERI